MAVKVPSRVRKTLGRIQKKIFLDISGPVPNILISGMARSGTTWVGDLINYDGSFRVLFEPFIPDVFGLSTPFNYIHYFPAEANSPVHEKYAGRILSGSLRSKWTDSRNDRYIYRYRMIKDVRTNLMLGWLQRISPGMKTVLLFRHPLSIAASWIKLNWGKHHNQAHQADLESILSQPALLDDYPVIKSLIPRLDLSDVFSRILLQYCIMYSVPLQQCNREGIYPLFYENLLLDFEAELRKLILYAGRDAEKALARIDANKTSITNYLHRDFSTGKKTVLAEWKSVFTEAQIESARGLLSEFGLDKLYDSDGYPALDVLPGSARS